MTLLQMVKFLRESILDDIGGTGVVWQDITEDLDEAQQLRWTNEELTSFLNESLRTAYRSGALVKEENTLFDITVLSDVSTYSFHEKLLEILDVYSEATKKSLIKMELEDLYNISDWRTLTGTPSYYIVDYNTHTIRLYPEPTSSTSVDITLITQSNPATVSSTNHGLVTGDVVTISGVEGMTEVNGNTYTVTVSSENLFTLNDTDSSGYTAYTSGGSFIKQNLDELHIFGTRLPLQDLDWAYAETDSPEINERYHVPIIHGAAYFAYMKDEANSFDPQRSEYFRNLFEREFGHLSHYGATRRSRTRNKTVRYGGL